MPGTSRGQSVTIKNGETVSDTPIEINGHDDLVGLDFPAAFTGATITFEAADYATATPAALHKEGAVYTINVTAGVVTSLDANVFQGRRCVWVKSGAAEGDDRILIPRFIERR